jgi:uncharacterized Rmd1/YagE family protein
MKTPNRAQNSRKPLHKNFKYLKSYMTKLHPIVNNYFHHFYVIYLFQNYGWFGATDFYEVSISSFGSVVCWQGDKISQRFLKS